MPLSRCSSCDQEFDSYRDMELHRCDDDESDFLEEQVKILSALIETTLEFADAKQALDYLKKCYRNL